MRKRSSKNVESDSGWKKDEKECQRTGDLALKVIRWIEANGFPGYNICTCSSNGDDVQISDSFVFAAGSKNVRRRRRKDGEIQEEKKKNRLTSNVII